MTDTYYMSNGAPWTVFNAEHVDSPEHFRLVAVIDPTDTEAVERLWRIWTTLAPDHRLAQDNMQAALREFAAPTPAKPEEPTGLGAVVEDAEGRRYVRTDFAGGSWHDASRDETTAWHLIDVARVVHEGVTA